MKIGDYKLGELVKDESALSEISGVEALAIPLSFKGERIRKAGTVRFFGASWDLIVGTLDGRIYKLSAQFSTDRIELADQVFSSAVAFCSNLCGESLKHPTETAWKWPAYFGNIVMDRLLLLGTHVLNFHATAEKLVRAAEALAHAKEDDAEGTTIPEDDDQQEEEAFEPPASIAAPTEEPEYRKKTSAVIEKFQARAARTEDDSEDEVFLIYGNERHGPYSLVGVSILRDKGTIPKDTLYWRQGMATPRPLAELTDEITVSLPRPHHYSYAYKWLPMLVFGSPISYEVRHSTTQQLLTTWGPAGEHYAPGNLDTPNGLSAEIIPLDPNAELLLITMPTPRRSTEAYFVGIVSSIPDDPKKIRFFVHSHSAANEKFGPAEGCVRELTADMKNFRAKDFIEPFKNDFIAAIQELRKSEPGGAFCVQPGA